MNRISPNDKRLKRSLIICCVVVYIVYILEGIPLSPLAFWNMIPLFISYIILKIGLNAKTSAGYFACVGFSGVCFAHVMFIHLAWFFDWWGLKTGSFYSGLFPIFYPFYAIVYGIIFSLLAWFVGWLVDKKKTV